jgi:hypothetical protein
LKCILVKGSDTPAIELGTSGTGVSPHVEAREWVV